MVGGRESGHPGGASHTRPNRSDPLRVTGWVGRQAICWRIVQPFADVLERGLLARHSGEPLMGYPTVEPLRAGVEAAKAVTMPNFERDWGTRDASQVGAALRHPILSASTADAAREACDQHIVQTTEITYGYVFQ